MGGFVHLRRDGGGSEGRGEVEVADLVLHAEEGGAETEADDGWEEPGRRSFFDENGGENSGGEVEKDPKPSVMVAVLGGVVELKIHEEQEEQGDDNLGDFHDLGRFGAETTGGE